jgi:hypothetical protein
MNTGTMIANAVTAGKSFKIRTTGKGFNQALQQLKALCQQTTASVTVVTESQEPVACSSLEPVSRMRRMYLSGKDRSVRVIKL